MRGEAYLAARQGVEAAAEFQKILDHRGIVVNEPIGAPAHLELARAYVVEAGVGAGLAPAKAVAAGFSPAGGDVALKGSATSAPLQDALARARRAYQVFFALWKDADPNIPVLQQAKAEYARLP